MSQPQSKFKPQPAGGIAGIDEALSGDNKWIVKKITLMIPADWWPMIEQYMKEHGHRTFPELLRDLIREKIVEGDQ